MDVAVVTEAVRDHNATASATAPSKPLEPQRNRLRDRNTATTQSVGSGGVNGAGKRDRNLVPVGKDIEIEIAARAIDYPVH